MIRSTDSNAWKMHLEIDLFRRPVLASMYNPTKTLNMGSLPKHGKTGGPCFMRDSRLFLFYPWVAVTLKGAIERLQSTKSIKMPPHLCRISFNLPRLRSIRSEITMLCFFLPWIQFNIVSALPLSQPYLEITILIFSNCHRSCQLVKLC